MAGWRSSRASATRTRIARTSGAWPSGRPRSPIKHGPEVHGWLGRALDGSAAPRAGPSAVFVGERDLPRALRGRRTVTASFADPADLSLAIPAAAAAAPDPSAGDDLAAFVNRTVTSAYTTAEQLADRRAAKRRIRRLAIPDSELGQHLELVARSIKAGAAARVYYTIQSGLRHARRAVADPGAVAR